MGRSVSRSPPAAGCCPGQRPAEGRAAASWCSSVPSAQLSPARPPFPAAPLPRPLPRPRPPPPRRREEVPEGGGCLRPARPRSGAGRGRGRLWGSGAGAPGAAWRRLRRTLSCARRLEGPTGGGDARFEEVPGRAQVRDVTGADAAACPARGTQAGSREGCGCGGRDSGGRGEAERCPCTSGSRWALRYPGLPLGLRWSRGGRRDSAPGVGEPRAGTGTVETHRRAGGRTEPPPRASGLNSRASSHCGTCVCPAAGGAAVSFSYQKKDNQTKSTEEE